MGGYFVQEIEALLNEFFPLNPMCIGATGVSFFVWFVEVYLQYFIMVLEGQKEEGPFCQQFKVNLDGSNMVWSTLPLKVGDPAVYLVNGDLLGGLQGCSVF